MDNMNIFDMLGIQFGQDEPDKKIVKGGKAKENKKGKAVKTEYIDVKNGVTLITGYYEPAILNSDVFASESVNEKDLIIELGKVYKEFTPNICSIKKLESSSYLIYFSSTKYLTNQKLVVNDGNYYCVRLAGFESVIEETEINKDIVAGIWENLYPEFKDCSYIYCEDSRVIVPVFNTEEEKKISIPATFLIFGRNEFIIDAITEAEDPTKNDGEFVDSGSDTEDEDTEPETIPVQQNNSDVEQSSKLYDSKLIRSSIECQFDELKNNYKLIKVNNSDYFIFPCDTSTSNKIEKEKTFPVENTILSLAFTKIPLEASMFDGQKAVTKKDILKFLEEDYPEYSEERTKVEYDKKHKMIIVYLTGSRKGANIIKSHEELLEIMQEPYSLVRFQSTEGIYRIEKTPIGIFIASLEKKLLRNEFIFQLTKIPFEIIEEIYCFFYNTYRDGLKKGIGPLEAACQIFYDRQKSGYFVYYPKQSVTKFSVTFERDEKLERDPRYILVMDIHSHHKMKPIFSITDDMDEKGTRLFAVMGEIQESGFKLNLRAGTGGLFIPLKPEDIFENYTTSVNSGITNLINISYSLI